MAGRSALYCSDNFMLVPRLRAAVMASGDGACAGEAQIENRSMPAMINRRLGMGSSDDRSRDETRKLSFPNQQTLAFKCAFSRGPILRKCQWGSSLSRQQGDIPARIMVSVVGIMT